MTTALLARCPAPVAPLPPLGSGPTLPLSLPKTLQFSMPKTLQFSMPIDSQRPSPKFRRVGFRIIRFEACSTFTRVPARMVAEPPSAAL